MVYIKDYILFYTLVNVFGHVVSLEEMSAVEDNDARITETIIRETVENLLATFKIKDISQNPKLNQFSTIHNFFLSITMKYFENLKRIVSLTRVNSIDNNTRHFITKINEVLDEGNKNIEERDDLYVTTHIETFLTKLRYLKEINGYNKHLKNLTVNADVLKILNNDDKYSGNFTYEINGNDFNNSDRDEVWSTTETSGRRIFQGHRTRIKYFPFMATVHFFKKFQCAGSIIRKDLVITAASCLQLAWNNRFFRENPAFLSVQIGCDFYRSGGEEISVTAIHFHPEYNPRYLKNNLALLRLSTHIIFSNKVGKVKRIEIDRRASPLPTNTNGITIVGWGARTSTSMIYNPWHNRLSFSELDYYPLHECQDVYSREYVSEKNFCAGFFSKGGGACTRDVGGPGISGGILVGVVSFGPPICGTLDAPTVFTKVGFYIDWIDLIMRQNMPAIVRFSTKLIPKPTFAFHYSDRTRRRFTVSPISKSFKPHVHAHEQKANLRILQDDKLFKDFMSTMFGDKASKEYRDPIEKVTVKTITNAPSSYEVESDEASNIKSEYKAEAVKHTQNKKSTAGSLDNQEEEKLHKDIVSILDDLDLYKLLDTDENIKPDAEFNDNVNLRARENSNLIESTGSGENELEEKISKSYSDSVEITSNNNNLNKIKTDQDDSFSAEVDTESDYEPSEVTEKTNEVVDVEKKEADELAELLAQDESQVLQVSAEGYNDIDEILSKEGTDSDDSNIHETEEMEDNVAPSSKESYESAYTKRYKKKQKIPHTIEDTLSKEDNAFTELENKDNKKSKTEKDNIITEEDYDSDKTRFTKSKIKLRHHRDRQADSELHDIIMEKNTEHKKKKRNKNSKKTKYEIDRKNKKNRKSQKKIRKSKSKLNEGVAEIDKKTAKDQSRKNKKPLKKQFKKKAKKLNVQTKSPLPNYDDNDSDKDVSTNAKSSVDDGQLSSAIDSL